MYILYPHSIFIVNDIYAYLGNLSSQSNPNLNPNPSLQSNPNPKWAKHLLFLKGFHIVREYFAS